jgi:aspartyl-tRNA(Asn)/glutamyl-tRNA(Gln) amidotransferase subunit A
MTSIASVVRKEDDLATLTAIEMLSGYRSGAFTPIEVIEDVIAALEREDRRLNLVATPLFDSARAQAEVATKAWRNGTPSGALTGVPVSVKDLIYVADAPAKGGSPTLADFVAPRDAAVVQRIRAAGAVITCKTTTCEAGYKLTADSPVTGITRNPWDVTRTSGGSSGGAAAGVAAGCGPLALGTDGVGSIRVPASFCGVFGLKPTFGLVPRSPGFDPPSWGSLAHTGPIARTVADAALLLSVIAGSDLRDAGSLPLNPGQYHARPGSLAGLRLAASVDLGYASVDPQVRNAFLLAVETLRRLGATVTGDALRLSSDVLDEILRPIAFTEQAAAVYGRDPSDFLSCEPEYREVIERGREFSGTDYIRATYKRGKLRGQFLDLFQSYDVLITPTVATVAFEAGTIGVGEIDGKVVDKHLGWSPFSWPMNLAGLPAATIPCGRTREGLPIGLQIVAPWLREQQILDLAVAFEKASGA